MPRSQLTETAPAHAKPSSTLAPDSVAQRFDLTRLRGVTPYALLAAFPLALFWKVLFRQTSSFFVNPDMIVQFYPWYQKLAQSLHHGYLPLWDANVYGGHSFVGEFQSGTFYPINLLWVAIFGTASGIQAVYLDLLVIVHFFLASVGMFLLCRQWRLSAPASIAGGMIFAYGGAVAYRAAGQSAIFFGLTLLPFALYFTAKYVDSGRARNLIFTGMVLGLQLLAGHVQPFFHTALLVTAYLIIPEKQTRNDYLVRLAQFPLRVFFVAGAVVITASPQLYLSAQYLGNAYRWVSAPNPIGPGEKVPYSAYAYHNIVAPHDFLNMLSVTRSPVTDGNDLYVGLLPLFLVGMVLLAPRLRTSTPAFSSHSVFLFSVAAFGAVVAVGHYTFVSRVLYHLPLGTQVREPGRYVVLLHFAVAALAAIAVDGLKGSDIGAWLRLRALLIAALSTAALAVATGHMPGAQSLSRADGEQVVLVIAFVIVLLAAPTSRTIRATAVLALLGLGIYFNSDTFVPVVQAGSPVQQQYARSRIIDYLDRLYPKYRVIDEGGALPDNIGDVYKIQTKLGHDATIYKPYFDFLNQDWSDGSKVNDLLNIRFIVSRQPHNLRIIIDDRTTGVKLYERKTYYPRVFFADELALPGKRIESLHQFGIIDYSDLSQTYRIRAPHQEKVVFSEIWYPGWHAYVDGKRVPLLTERIDGLLPLLREVNVPPGTHTVHFSYLDL